MTAPRYGLDDVRTGCAEVAADADHVQIDQGRLTSYAQELATLDLAPPAWDGDHHFTGTPEELALFVFTLDAINFGSGWFPVLRKSHFGSGYATISGNLTRAFRDDGPWDVTTLRAMTPATCAHLFRQEGNAEVDDLMALFARALRDLGTWLDEHGDGSPMAVLRATNGSAEQLVMLLQEMPLFRDVGDDRARTVPLLKRAQLLAADLSLALAGDPLVAFRDLDRLTLFADNLVPHVLRMEGVLTYEPALLARINAGELLITGSPEEVEMRSVAVHAVDVLVAELRAAGRDVTAARLDHLLWHRGQSPAIKAEPRHRCRCPWY